jgi:hypothetical protein
LNIQDLLTIIEVSVPDIEEQLGREMTSEEKKEMVRGAISKWNLTHPDNWLVIPAEYSK